MRLAIVNDMTLGIEAMRRVICSVPGYQVIWVAKNGAEAVEKCQEDCPDIILMDLLMPVMDGVEATRQIMQNSPCAILVVTATVSGNVSKVFDAMGCGALDAVCTPSLGPNGSAAGAEDLLAKIKMIGVLMGKGKTTARSLISPRPVQSSRRKPLVAIGASTGGPQALGYILANLPSDFPAAVVIVQHVDALFAPGLAEWLGVQSKIKVNLIQPGCTAESGQAWMTCTNDHVIVNSDLTFDYTPEPRDYAYRPSVDVFFESVAKHWPSAHTAVLLTGMGRDGARGLLSLRQHHWHTIAQDKASCVVYGMPKAAVELDAANEILPLKEIASRLINLHFMSGGL